MIPNFSSLVLIFFLLFVASSYAIPAEQVSAICKQTKNPSFCITLLNSKPNADLVALTQFTIDTTRANITNTIKLVNSLIAGTNDPKAKNHYKSCLGHFKDAIGNTDYSQELLKKGDYLGVNVAASAVLTDVDDCVSGESPSDPAIHDSSQLPQYAAVLEDDAKIILVISNMLR